MYNVCITWVKITEIILNRSYLFEQRPEAAITLFSRFISALFIDSSVKMKSPLTLSSRVEKDICEIIS